MGTLHLKIGSELNSRMSVQLKEEEVFDLFGYSSDHLNNLLSGMLRRGDVERALRRCYGQLLDKMRAQVLYL